MNTEKEKLIRRGWRVLDIARRMSEARKLNSHVEEFTIENEYADGREGPILMSVTPR
jgi:hypothetical protein